MTCRMRKHIYILLRFAVLFVVAALTSCSLSIWEVRDHCPSWLSFDFASSEAVADSVVLMMNDGGGPVTGAEFVFGKPYSIQEFEVERGLVDVVVFSGQDRSLRSGSVIMTREGEQADSLFVHSLTVDCTGEFAHVDVDLKKQWVTVHLTINNLTQTKADFQFDDFTAEVISDVSGLDMNGLIDVPGVFRYSPELDMNGKATFRIYRHADAEEDLYLNIYKKDVLIDMMPLGEELSIGGLDWNAESLDDASVNINIVTGDVRILVIPWENKGHEDIEF